MIYHIPSGMAYLPYHPQPVAVPTRRHESHNMQMRCSTSTYDQTFFCSAVSFMEFPIHQILPATVRRLQESVILCQFGVDMHLVLSLHWHSFYLNFCICFSVRTIQGKVDRSRSSTDQFMQYCGSVPIQYRARPCVNQVSTYRTRSTLSVASAPPSLQSSLVCRGPVVN